MSDFNTQQLILSIGWALIHFLWQGTLITIAYWVITRNIESIHAKYWTGMGLVVLSLIILFFGIGTVTESAPSEETLVLLSQTIISHQQLNLPGLLLYFINISLPFVVLVWAAVVTFLSIRLSRSWLQLAAIKHQCEPQVSSQLKQYIKNVAIKLDLPTIPFLKISKQIKVPAAYGILKPTILLPLSLISQIPKNQLEAIITHELCHLKRNDFLHNIVQLLADIILFFHPGIRWMNNDIRHIREQCCDQMVLAQDTETLTYAKALTNIAALTNGIKLKPSVQLGINDGVLLNRVKFLLQNKSSQSSLVVFLPLLFIVFTILLLQPSQSLTGNSSLNQESDNQQQLAVNDDSLNLYRRHMGEQSFYPKFNREYKKPSDSNIITDNMELTKTQTKLIDSQLITMTSSQTNTERHSINKDQLQVELNQGMSINSYESNIIPNEINAFKPLTKRLTDGNPSQPTADKSLVTNPKGKPANNPSVNVPILERSSAKTASSIIPTLKRYIAPEYPKSHWYDQIEQDVIATFKIQSDGRVYDINLHSQNNNLITFEHAVEKAMKYWRFDVDSLNTSTLQRTYQRVFSFNITDKIMNNCEIKPTGTRISRSVPCNK